MDSSRLPGAASTRGRADIGAIASGAESPAGAAPPPPTVSEPSSAPLRTRLFARSREDRVVFGIAGGLGEWLGVDPILVRLGFAALAAASGFGIALYILAWLLSAEPGSPVVNLRRPASAIPKPQQIAAIGCITLGTLLVLRALGFWLGDTLVWPVALAAAGSALIWARSDEGDRARWTRVGARLPGNPVQAVFGGRVSPVRVAIGGLLVAAGMAIFLAANQALAAARTAVLAIVVTAIGLGMILGPWIIRLVRQAADERRQRIRSEERAEIAAHLHDSVLHTLALIQRADAPPEVVGLARRQERELRAWLNGRPVLDSETTLRGAIDVLASQVEASHGIAVDTVVVGDAPLDERCRALVLACQEAVTNAARHAGVKRVSVYVEVESDAITGYVRDQGAGFDPEMVSGDRRGIEESIRGRMRRQGGTASIQSGHGEGTEVQLRMPRSNG